MIKSRFLSLALTPGWDATDGTRAPVRDPKSLAETDGRPDGFQDYLIALRDEVVAFRRPVAYVHGDSPSTTPARVKSRSSCPTRPPHCWADRDTRPRRWRCGAFA